MKRVNEEPLSIGLKPSLQLINDHNGAFALTSGSNFQSGQPPRAGAPTCKGKLDAVLRSCKADEGIYRHALSTDEAKSEIFR